MKKNLSYSALLLGLLTAFRVDADPWIDPTDPLIRSSVEILVNQGVIKRPVNTYPLMWQGLAQDLERVRPARLSDSASFAYYHLKQSLRFARKDTASGIRVLANSAPQQQQGFNERDQARSAVETFGSMTGKTVSAKVAVNIRRDATDGKKLDHNGSYLAVLLGNWSLSAEKISHWWGPGNENALALSNNATPMSGVRLSRHNSDYFGPGWLSFVGPWQISALYAKQKPVVNVSEHTTFWGIRATAMPLQGLELGLSLTDSEQLSFPQLESVTGVKELPDERRMSALDFKYSTQVLSLPLALYGEWAGHRDSQLIARHGSYTFGLESYFGNADQLFKSYLEYSDTYHSCLADFTDYNCNYGENGVSGYLQRGLSLAPAIGANVKSAALGVYYHTIGGYGGHLKLRRLNFDDEGSLLTSSVQLEAGYQQELLRGLLKLSASVGRDKSAQGSETIHGVKASWEYRF